MPVKSKLQLSIILPIYNVAPYLEKCIRSLEDQDLPKDTYEVICVNDGSPDNSQQIVEKLQQEFSNIILINQQNQGVSVARNVGLEKANGDYILFVDPDDHILGNTLLKIVQNAKLDNLEVLYLDFNILSVEGKNEWSTNFKVFENKIYDGVDGYFAPRGKGVRDPDASVAKLYKRSFLVKYSLNYPKDVPYLEDGLFLIKVLSVAIRVGFLNMNFYQRTTRPGSATQSTLFYSDKAINGFINGALNLRDFANKNILTNKQTELINHGLAKFVILSLSPSIFKFNIVKYFEIIRLLKKENLAKLETRGLRFVYSKHVKMYNFSKYFFPFFFYFNNKL